MTGRRWANRRDAPRDACPANRTCSAMQNWHAADRLGFRALWVRDVPVYDPAFGDAAQVFEVQLPRLPGRHHL